MLVPTERVIPEAQTAVDGVIRWDAPKSLWWFAHAVGGAAAVFLFPAWDAAFLFVLLTGMTICAGHSVGMHRLLIHRSFDTPRPVLWVLVWLGTLVGMAGPFGMIRAHDMRDWHQRQTTCPPHPSHGAGFWRDAWWQMHCRYDLDHPPRFEIEATYTEDPVLVWMERTWMLQQLPLAIVLYLWGGVGFVLWGMCLRVVVSLTGHWAVGHYAHRSGHQGWRITGLPVQGYNLPGLGLLTFGENWHGNHHAFPHSAKLGVDPGQLDPGYWFIRLLAAIRLATDIRGPQSEHPCAGLTRVGADQ